MWKEGRKREKGMKEEWVMADRLKGREGNKEESEEEGKREVEGETFDARWQVQPLMERKREFEEGRRGREGN